MSEVISESQQAERKERLKAAMASLAVELEVKDGHQFSINKGVEESIKVLQHAAASNDRSVITHLYKVVMQMTAAQLQFFQSKGIMLDLHALDRKMARMERHR